MIENMKPLSSASVTELKSRIDDLEDEVQDLQMRLKIEVQLAKGGSIKSEPGEKPDEYSYVLRDKDGKEVERIGRMTRDRLGEEEMDGDYIVAGSVLYLLGVKKP